MQSLQAVKESDFLTLVDLPEAYLHVPIHPAHRTFLCFCHAGNHYQYCALPFGLSFLPRVFIKLMAALVGHLWTMPIRIQFYLDYLLIQSCSESLARTDMDTTLQVL